MKDVITIIEGLLYAIKSVKDGKICYYLKGVKNYESGKTFKWVQFIERLDYEQIKKEFEK